MEIKTKVQKKTGEQIEVSTADKVAADKQKNTFTFKPGADNACELEALREVLERNSYGGKMD